MPVRLDIKPEHCRSLPTLCGSGRSGTSRKECWRTASNAVPGARRRMGACVLRLQVSGQDHGGGRLRCDDHVRLGRPLPNFERDHPQAVVRYLYPFFFVSLSVFVIPPPVVFLLPPLPSFWHRCLFSLPSVLHCNACRLSWPSPTPFTFSHPGITPLRTLTVIRSASRTTASHT
jgi:hypothetical protein